MIMGLGGTRLTCLPENLQFVTNLQELSLGKTIFKCRAKQPKMKLRTKQRYLWQRT